MIGLATMILNAAGLVGQPMLGYRPFLDPLHLDGYWLALLVPIAAAISVVYKAVKIRDLTQLPRQASIMIGQIVIFMIVAAVGVYLFVEVIM